VTVRANNTRDIVDRLKRFFDAHVGDDLACAYLFGSLARGSEHAHSDVDVAVLAHKDPKSRDDALRLDLADKLEAVLSRPVDLVVLHQAPVDLVHRVLRDGILVSEKDRSKRVQFEVRVRNEYFDLLPYLRQYRRSAANPIHE